jgi:hypothetical protein
MRLASLIAPLRPVRRGTARAGGVTREAKFQ